MKEEKDKLKIELDEIYSVEAKGAQVRSKAKWVEEGERSTKYFLSLENKHQTLNTISKLSTEDGLTITDANSILKECKTFYRNLYTSEKIDIHKIRRYLANVHIPKIDNKTKLTLDSDITEKELYAAVHRLKHNKSPGTDGIIPEFYQTFWHILKKPFTDMMKETFKRERCAIQ